MKARGRFTREEPFLKSLKYEEVYRNDYRDLEDAYRGIRGFIQRVYNRKALHSTLGYLPPIEFGRACQRRANDAHHGRLLV